MRSSCVALLWTRTHRAIRTGALSLCHRPHTYASQLCQECSRPACMPARCKKHTFAQRLARRSAHAADTPSHLQQACPGGRCAYSWPQQQARARCRATTARLAAPTEMPEACATRTSTKAAAMRTQLTAWLAALTRSEPGRRVAGIQAQRPARGASLTCLRRHTRRVCPASLSAHSLRAGLSAQCRGRSMLQHIVASP